MDNKSKAKWIEALRSGEFKQARGFLFDDEAYCCLGVLCKIRGADFDAIKAKFGTLSLCSSPEEFLGDVRKYADRLSTMNDQGASFSEIADYIEQNL